MRGGEPSQTPSRSPARVAPSVRDGIIAPRGKAPRFVLEEEGAASVTSPPPLPPQPLPYARPGTDPGRPGVLVAIGIASLIVGVLSVAASGFAALFWFGMYAGSRPPSMPTPAPLPPPSFPAYTGGPTPRATGLPAGPRAAVVAGTPLDGPFAADRRAMLDLLLAECGTDLFPTAPPAALVPAPIDTAANRRHRAPTDPADVQAQLIFDVPGLPGGQVVLTANQAQFECLHKRNGSTGWQTLDTTTVGPATVELPFATRGPRHRYTAAAVDRAVHRLQASTPGMTRMQAGFVANALAAPQESVYTVAGRGEMTGSPSVAATLGAGNVLAFDLNHAGYLVLPDGRGIAQGKAPYGLDPATGAPNPAPFPPNFRPALAGDARMMLGLAIDCCCVIGLDVLLVVVAVRALAGPPPAAVRGHLWYAALKFALIAAEVALSAGFIASVTGYHGPPPRRPYNVAAGQSAVAMTVVVQSIYPICLLAVLRSAGLVRASVARAGATVSFIEPAWRRAAAARWRAATRRSPGRLLAWGAALVATAIVAVQGASAVVVAKGGDAFGAALHAAVAIVVAVPLVALCLAGRGASTDPVSAGVP